MGGEASCLAAHFSMQGRVSIAAGVVVFLVAGLIACGPPVAKPDRAPPVPVAAPSPTDDRPPTYLVIRLKARQLDLIQGDAPAPLGTFPIAVGRAGHETPIGSYRVEEMIEHPDYQKIDPKDPTRVLKHIPPGPANPLGERWIGFIRGDGWTIGIHGTPQPDLLGRAVSGGCIRMRNADVIRVFDQVRVGTPVIVRP
jgi:L,D-transpeptidase ErfK/SrfK